MNNKLCLKKGGSAAAAAGNMYSINADNNRGVAR